MSQAGLQEMQAGLQETWAGLLGMPGRITILPIIIKIMRNTLEFVNRLLNSISFKPYIPEDDVFVKVNTASLKELSKPMLSKSKIPDRMKRLIKKEIKTKKESLMLLSFIFFSEKRMFWFTILFGFANLSISIKLAFNKI